MVSAYCCQNMVLRMVYRIVLIFCGSKFSWIAIFENFIEIILWLHCSNMPCPLLTSFWPGQLAGRMHVHVIPVQQFHWNIPHSVIAARALVAASGLKQYGLEHAEVQNRFWNLAWIVRLQSKMWCNDIHTCGCSWPANRSRYCSQNVVYSSHWRWNSSM